MTEPKHAYNTMEELFLDPNRWTRTQSTKTAFTLWGGLKLIYGLTDEFKLIYKRLCSVLPRTKLPLADFNDAESTTHADILAVCRKAKV